jgi:hypothetical protein
MTGIDERVGASVKPDQFIIDSIYSPEQIKAIGEAFNGAWARIAPTAGTSPESVHAARLRLADVLLRLAKEKDDFDPKRLKEAALESMFAAPRTL